MKLRMGVLLLTGLLLAGCDQGGNDARHIKVGVINGAEQDVAEVAKKVAKEKGYTDTLFFVDDGITGTTLGRPGFNEMIKAIERRATSPPCL